MIIAGDAPTPIETRTDSEGDAYRELRSNVSFWPLRVGGNGRTRHKQRPGVGV